MSHYYISVVIPAYNEAKRITKSLHTISNFLEKQQYSYEILVVDDGSRDNTAKVASALKLPHVNVLHSPVNRGKGFAVNRGVLASSGQYILMCDADNATPFEQVTKLLAEMDNHEVVIGSRYLPESYIHLKQPLLRIIGSRIFNLIVQLVLLPGFSDTQCGFKLFTHDAAHNIFERQTIWGWGFDLEILVLAKKFKYRVKQVPVDWYDQEGSKMHSAFDFLSTVVEVFKIKWLFATRHRNLKPD